MLDSQGDEITDWPVACPLLIDSAEPAAVAPQTKVFAMQLRIGYELIYRFPQPTPIILVVNVHDSRASDIIVPDRLTAEPSIPISGYRDAFIVLFIVQLSQHILHRG